MSTPFWVPLSKKTFWVPLSKKTPPVSLVNRPLVSWHVWILIFFELDGVHSLSDCCSAARWFCACGPLLMRWNLRGAGRRSQRPTCSVFPSLFPPPLFFLFLRVGVLATKDLTWFSKYKQVVPAATCRGDDKHHVVRRAAWINKIDKAIWFSGTVVPYCCSMWCYI
jgi:hypothetical protein